MQEGESQRVAFTGWLKTQSNYCQVAFCTVWSQGNLEIQGYLVHRTHTHLYGHGRRWRRKGIAQVYLRLIFHPRARKAMDLAKVHCNSTDTPIHSLKVWVFCCFFSGSFVFLIIQPTYLCFFQNKMI